MTQQLVWHFNEAFQSINDKTYDYVKGLFPSGCIQIDALKCENQLP